MANTINLITKYLPKTLDQVWKLNSLSTFMENEGAIKQGLMDSATVYIKNIAMSGLGDYSRTGDLPDGNIDVTWASHTLSVERGKKFTIDPLDSMESQTDLLDTVSIFVKEKVTPEVDAYRFAKAYQNAGNTVTGTLDASTIKAAIDLGLKTQFEAEVPEENKVIYISGECFDYLKNTTFFTYNLQGDMMGGRDTRVASYQNIPVIKVPATRFNTAVTLGADGYTRTGQTINFMIVHKDSALAITKWRQSQIVPASVNASNFRDTFKFAMYHDVISPANKTDGIYAHAKAAITS